jgi:hypothetical protein
MKAWLAEPSLAPFAVRVLSKIAGHEAYRGVVLETLQSVDVTRLSDVLAEDVLQSIAAVRALSARSPRAGRQPRALRDEWPGNRTVSDLERRFHNDMLDVFRRVGEATRRPRADGSTARGYWAIYFLRGVRNHGGLAYARQLLRAEGTTTGFQRLADEDRLDLTAEALVLRPEYAELFTDEERATAARRLGGRRFPERPDLAGSK